jgi:hypothetical protein
MVDRLLRQADPPYQVGKPRIIAHRCGLSSMKFYHDFAVLGLNLYELKISIEAGPHNADLQI